MIKIGLSNTIKQRIGNTYFKVANTKKQEWKLVQEHNWFDDVDKKLNTYSIGVSVVTSIRHETILMMPFIEHKHFDHIDMKVLGMMLEDFKKVEYSNLSFPTHRFQTYLDYIVETFTEGEDKYIRYMHDGEFYQMLEELKKREVIADSERSFCHGDLSIDNILCTQLGRLIPIDANPHHEFWSSWLHDLAKFRWSVRFDRPDLFALSFDLIPKGYVEFIEYLELSHALRVMPYAEKIGGETYEDIIKKFQLLKEIVL